MFATKRDSKAIRRPLLFRKRKGTKAVILLLSYTCLCILLTTAIPDFYGIFYYLLICAIFL